MMPKTKFVHWIVKLSPMHWKLSILLQDMHSPDENKIYFTKNEQIENEHFRDTRISGIHEIEELKRTQELRVDEFFKRKTDQESKHYSQAHGQGTGIAQFMRSIVWMIQENVRMPNQCAVDKYPTFPANMRYFLFQLVSRARNPQPESWNAHGFSGNVFANSPAYSSTPCSRMLNSWDVHATGKIPMQASTRQPAAESGARDKDTIPTPRFLRNPSARNSFNPVEGRNLKNYGSDQ